MHLRQLLNVAYARLAHGRDEEQLAELDKLLESEPPIEEKRRKPRTGRSTGTAALLAAAALPQVGAAQGPRRRRPAAEGVQ